MLIHANTLPWHHRDLAERFIIATAQMETITVVTSDGRFKDDDVETLACRGIRPRDNDSRRACPLVFTLLFTRVISRSERTAPFLTVHS
ncbi:MAG: hypothetical protein OSB41_01650 [Kiritimatiellae bacterium]|nr:hypothetical protein [Kiritimatiellia bacterium]